MGKITNIIHQKRTDGGVYIGTRRAVYYRNNSLSDWQLFNSNLPLSTTSTRLIPQYFGNKIYNATNRSVYECELYENSDPIAQISSDRNELTCLDTLIQFVDHSVMSSTDATWSWSFPGGTPSSSTDQHPVVSYSVPGSYDVTLTVTDTFGTSTQTLTNFITVLNNVEMTPLVEDFSLGFDPDWVLRNANNTYNWGLISVVNGPDCVPTQCATVNHFDINSVPDEGELLTPKIDLSGLGSAELTYDYAYAEYASNYSDGFRVDISTDCGATWDMLYEEHGDSLATVPDQTNWWEPTHCNDWENNVLDISAYIGNEVMIRFVAINVWGNNFYLDNINIDGTVDVNEPAELAANLYPNPSNGTFTVVLSETNAVINIFSMDGKLVSQHTSNNGRLTIDSDLSQGVYLVRIVAGNKTADRRLVITD